MAFVKRNDLKRFINKLDNYKSNSMVSKLMRILQEKLYEYAIQEYIGTDTKINKPTIDGNKIVLSVEGEHIAYLEFGTGLVGEASGYPKDKLPTQTITFESHGKQYKTDGWEYYYDNPDTKIMGGWFFGGTFTRGNVAGMQMFNISKRIREYIQNELANDLKGMK